MTDPARPTAFAVVGLALCVCGHYRGRHDSARASGGVCLGDGCPCSEFVQDLLPRGAAIQGSNREEELPEGGYNVGDLFPAARAVPHELADVVAWVELTSDEALDALLRGRLDALPELGFTRADAPRLARVLGRLAAALGRVTS